MTEQQKFNHPDGCLAFAAVALAVVAVLGVVMLLPWLVYGTALELEESRYVLLAVTGVNLLAIASVFVRWRRRGGSMLLVGGLFLTYGVWILAGSGAVGRLVVAIPLCLAAVYFFYFGMKRLKSESLVSVPHTLPTSIAGSPRVIDLRDQKARTEEELATRPLAPEDEAAADELVILAPLARRALEAGSSSDDASRHIRSCGEALHARGGDGLMRLVAHRALYRLKQRGERITSRQFEHWWNGIGGWEY